MIDLLNFVPRNVKLNKPTRLADFLKSFVLSNWPLVGNPSENSLFSEQDNRIDFRVESRKVSSSWSHIVLTEADGAIDEERSL